MISSTNNIIDCSLVVITPNGNIDLGTYYDKGWANIVLKRYTRQNNDNPLFIECQLIIK